MLDVHLSKQLFKELKCYYQSVYLECLIIEKIAGKTIMEANKQALMPMTATYPMLLSPG
jgi:hypothetical protein